VKRYPHTAVIKYYTTSILDSGVVVENTLATFSIDCNIQESNYGNSYILNANGDKIPYRFRIYSGLFDSADELRKRTDLTIDFFDEEHHILSIFPFQKHVEILCKD